MARNRNRSVFSQGSPSSGVAGRMLRMLFVVIVVAILGGIVFMGVWDFQPERTVVERQVSPGS